MHGYTILNGGDLDENCNYKEGKLVMHGYKLLNAILTEWKLNKEGGPGAGIFPNFRELFRKNERFSQKESMRNRQKAVPLGKISDF